MATTSESTTKEESILRVVREQMPQTMLGALRYMSMNAKQSESLELWKYDLRTGDGIVGFAEAVEGNVQMLIDLGSEARRHRCSMLPYERVIDVSTTARDVSVNWSWGLGDHEVNGTMRYDADEEQNRMHCGTTWVNNSCAFNAGFMCALWSNVGRTMCDQLPPAKLRQLSEPARLLRVVLQLKWGDLTLIQRDQIRDAMIRSLAGSDEKWSWLGAGKMGPAAELIVELYRDSPQMQMHWIHAYQCCGRWVMKRGAEIVRWIGIQHVGWAGSFEAALCKQLTPTAIDHLFPCFDGREECPGVQHKVRCILDRLPPSLVVRCQGVMAKDALARGGFARITLRYFTLGNQMEVSYLPYLAVYDVGGHFVARVNLGGMFYHHDGMALGDTTNAKDWTTGVDESTMVLIQYRQEGVATVVNE